MTESRSLFSQKTLSSIIDKILGTTLNFVSIIVITAQHIHFRWSQKSQANLYDASILLHFTKTINAFLNPLKTNIPAIIKLRIY